MKTINTLIFACISCFIISSCSNQIGVIETCTIEITLEPLCSWNPADFPNAPLPVRVLENGVPIESSTHTFTWSSDPDFTGSAISVTYNQLPLTGEATDKVTGCVGEATLDQSFWD